MWAPGGTRRHQEAPGGHMKPRKPQEAPGCHRKHAWCHLLGHLLGEFLGARSIEESLWYDYVVPFLGSFLRVRSIACVMCWVIVWVISRGEKH